MRNMSHSKWRTMMHILSLRSHNFYFMCSHRSPSIPSLTYDVATGYVLCRDTMKIRYILSSYPTLPYPTPPYPTLCYLILCYPMLSYHTLSYPTSGIYSSPILPFLLLSYPTLWYSLTSPPSSCSCSSSPTLSYLMLPYALLCSPIHLHLLSADSFIGFFLLVL